MRNDLSLTRRIRRAMLYSTAGAPQVWADATRSMPASRRKISILVEAFAMRI